MWPRDAQILIGADGACVRVVLTDVQGSTPREAGAWMLLQDGIKAHLADEKQREAAARTFLDHAMDFEDDHKLNAEHLIYPENFAAFAASGTDERLTIQAAAGANAAFLECGALSGAIGLMRGGF